MANTVELTEEGTPRPLPEPGSDPMLGRVLLHYKVAERIGQGGMSVVYRGIDQRLGRPVAIKVLHPFLAEKAECRARLAREARAVARLEHENILRIFDFSGDPATLDETVGSGSGDGDDDDDVRDTEEGFLVTELVLGTTLKRFADRHRLWDLPEVGALVVWQLARALEHAHAQGVVHRDIKPENVMVREDGTLKLMDFGIAQVVDSKSLTVTGTLLGSPAHMAPECIEGLHADNRSDIFSLGTVLYWLMCGALPFEAISPHALLKAIVDGRCPPPQQRQPRVSDELARVLSRAMATRPDDRYQTAGAFADALADALHKGGIDANAKAVAEVLADPRAAFPHLSATVRQATLARARTLLDEGAPAKALSAVGRVLAEHPHDPEAQALIEQAQSGAWDEEEEEADEEADRGPVPEATEAHPVTAVTGELALPDGPAPSAASVWLGRAGLLGVTALVFAVVVVVGLRIETNPLGPAADPGEARGGDELGGMSLVAEPGPRPAEQKAPPVAVAGDDAALKRSLRQPADPARDPDRIAGDRRGPREAARKDLKAKDAEGTPVRTAQAEARVPGAPARPPAEASPADGEASPPTPVVAASSARRKVLIKVNSYGSLLLPGGAKVALSPQVINEVELPVGAQRVTFEAPAALPQEMDLEVRGDGPQPRVAVRFEPRPAMLVVECDAPDAFVAAKPQWPGAKEKLLGQAKDSINRPFIVGFPSDEKGRLVGKLTFDLTVSHGGHIVTRQVDLRAGQQKKVRVMLETPPDGAGAEPSETPPAP